MASFMTGQRLSTAFSLTGHEFLRRRGMLAFMFGTPLFGYVLIFAALPEIPASLEAIENGVRVVIDTDQRALFGGLQALIYVGLLAGLAGFYLLRSALSADRRLILAGFSPAELVAARIGVLMVIDLAISLFLVALMMVFTQPRQLPAYLLATYWTALIYSLYGALAGTYIRNELGGILAVMFLVNIDVGYLQLPGFSTILDEWYIVLFPGYFPVQLAIDSAFTATLEMLGMSFWSLAHGSVVGLAVLYGYERATHIYRYALPQPGARIKQFLALVLAVALLTGGGLYAYAAYQNRPPVVEADGRIEAPEGRVVALLNGRVQELAVTEGQKVALDEIVAWLEDPLTQMRLPARAPVAGTVTSATVRQNENVVQGTVLATIHELDRMEVRLEVEESYVGKVVAGQRVALKSGAMPETINGSVVEIAQEPLPPEPGATERNRRIRKYQVKVALPQPDERLRLGMAVHATIYQ